MFPCQKTILGDFSQSVNPNHMQGLEDLRTIYDKAQFVELNKSYRSTYEIMEFAGKIHPVSALEPVKRHGEPPALIPCLDAADELRKIREAIRCFRTGKNVSLGIILKTDAAAKDMYEVLEGDDDISLINPESASFQNGISITSVRMSKGLEYDEVLIPQADCKTYASDFDRSLLYIACTRAMHRLTLMYSGKETEFISGQALF